MFKRSPKPNQTLRSEFAGIKTGQTGVPEAAPAFRIIDLVFRERPQIGHFPAWPGIEQ